MTQYSTGESEGVCGMHCEADFPHMQNDSATMPTAVPACVAEILLNLFH